MPKSTSKSLKDDELQKIVVKHFKKTNPTKKKFTVGKMKNGAIIQFGDYSTRIYEVDANKKVKLVGSN